MTGTDSATHAPPIAVLTTSSAILLDVSASSQAGSVTAMMTSTGSAAPA